MSRQISDLPKEIQNLVEQRREIEGATYLHHAFVFSTTPEGSEFWTKIGDGDYTGFYEKYPKQEKFEEGYYNFIKEKLQVLDAEGLKNVILELKQVDDNKEGNYNTAHKFNELCQQFVEDFNHQHTIDEIRNIIAVMALAQASYRWAELVMSRK